MATILLVEDNEDLLNIYALKLQSEGYFVITATDGIDGIQKAKKQNPDLILLDILMPYVNGFEVLRTLRNATDHQHIPILVLSNISEPDQMSEAYSLGADAFFTKATMNPDDIIAKIKHYITQHAKVANTKH